MTTRPESSAEDLDYARKLVATLTSRPLRSGERVRLMAARSILGEMPAGNADQMTRAVLEFAPGSAGRGTRREAASRRGTR